MAAGPRGTRRLPIIGDRRLIAAAPFGIIGGICVVAGGFVAAATASFPTEHGAWVAAYLVLVGGVAPAALGAGQAHLAVHPPAMKLVAAQVIAWNAGSAAVIAGTLVTSVWLVDAGGAALLLTLVAMLWSVRGAQAGPRWWRYAYRLLAAAVLVSVPVGLLLARIS